MASNASNSFTWGESTSDLENLELNVGSAGLSSEWSDTIFRNNYLSSITKRKMPDLLVKTGFAKTFLNTYVSGQGGINMLKEYERAFTLIELGEIPLFSGDIVGENIFTPDSEIDKIPSIAMLWTSGDRQMTGPVDSVVMTNQLAQTWYDFIWNKLEVNETRVDGLIYVGYLALTVCRIFTKSPESIDNHIVKNFNSRVSNLFPQVFCDDIVPLCPPPHKNFYTLVGGSLSKDSPNGKRMLACLIYLTCLGPQGHEIFEGVMTSSCMLSLSETGLGLLNWLMKASKAKEVKPLTILKYFAGGKTELASQEVVRMLIKVNSTNMKTWKYARLLDSKAFMEFSIPNNKLFSLTLAYLASGEDSEYLLSIPSFRTALSQAETAKSMAHKISLTLDDVDPSTGKTEEYRKLANMMKQGTVSREPEESRIEI